MLKSLNLKTIVVKIGTKVLTGPPDPDLPAGRRRAGRGYSLDREQIQVLVDQIAVIVKSNIRVAVVSSGAIGAGMGALKLKQRPAALSKLQACAAIGQSLLMQVYDGLFKGHGILTAQILLTREDLDDRKRYLNAKSTIQALLEQGVVPIINENDTISTEEIKFGDNDRLSSLVANLISADLLILLSDVDGLYRHEGIKKEDRILIAVVDKITGGIEALAQKGTDELGTGGMISKLQAAKTCASSGLSCIIANGKRPDVLTDIILKREKVGTLFLPASAKMGARKCWLGFCAKTKGHIKVDDGAKEALMRNKSLLASGVIGVGGDFKKDDIVSIVDSCGTEFARGAAGCDSPTIEKIKGLKTSQIHAVLGCRVDEIVHRDNLVIL